MKNHQTPYYNLVWRWHFYAGLLIMPILLMLAITGSIYLFKPQLDAWMYPNLLQVSPIGQHVEADVMLAKIKAQYPEANPKKYLPPCDNRSSAQFLIGFPDGGERTVFVDPYLNLILSEQDPNWTLQGIAKRLHSELMIGEWGDLLIELAASWTIMMIYSDSIFGGHATSVYGGYFYQHCGPTSAISGETCMPSLVSGCLHSYFLC